jgi:ADP-ribose pyrophosphatase
VARGPTSAGITDEEIVLYVAGGLRRVGPGGGDSSEDIRVHVVPLPGVEAWLAQKASAGAAVDLKVYAGLHFARAGAG